MARTTGPLMSMDASGSIGKTLTYAKWKGRNYVRGLVIPSNPQSDAQTAVRASMKFLSQIWASLSALIQSHWADGAKIDNITPMNELIRVDQKRIRAGFGALQDPTFTPGAVEAAPAGVTATGQYTQILVAYTDSVGADDWCTFIYSDLTPGFTPSAVNLVAIVPAGVQQFTDTGLTTGDTWYYRVGGCETGGVLGTLAAEVNAVVQ